MLALALAVLLVVGIVFLVGAQLGWFPALATSDGAGAASSLEYHHKTCRVMTGEVGKETLQTMDCSTGVKDPLAKKILADGKVSQEEWQAAKAEYIACLTRGGIEKAVVNADGSETVTGSRGMSTDDVTQVDETCESRSGTDFGDIDFKFQQSRLNPHNYSPQKVNQMRLDCLVKAGLLPRGTTTDDFARMGQANSFPFDPESQPAMACLRITG